MIKGLPDVNTEPFKELLGKQTSITIKSKDGIIWHKFDGIDFLKVEKQKTTGMKNAPEKRIADGKAFTPPMLCLGFSGGNNLVFVVGDFKLVTRYKGLSFIFDNYEVDIVEYEAV
jgi:hypothetical protein